MEWAQKRKIIYSAIFAGIIILLASYPIYSLVRSTPSCFDGKKNGTENGVDCGGGCARVCTADTKPPIALWVKAFPTGGNTYDLAAYVENTNETAGVKNARYTIRVLDSSGKLLVERKNSTELAPASRVLLFNAGVTISGVPARVEISFDTSDISIWTRATTAAAPVVTKNQSLKNPDTRPRFDAVLVNTDSINDLSDLNLSVIIYDAERKPVAVSNTYVNSISKGGEQNIFFTWPSRLTKYARGEMCIDPQEVGTPDKATTTSPEVHVLCPIENFITEIIVTPRAIFAE